MTIVRDISFEGSAFLGNLTGNVRERLRNELRFSAIHENDTRSKACSVTFSLTFRLERDISESPYFMHLIYYEHLERRNGMKHYSTCVRVAFVFAVFLLLSTG